jgi:predicted secreted hydrolase
MKSMWRWIAVVAVGLAVALVGFSLIDGGRGDQVGASALLAAGTTDTTGFARAVEPRDWQFPRDFGANPEYLTEWWYYTGNLAAEDGRRFGFQFTIFRRGITPGDADGGEWRANQLYMAHFAITDVRAERFHHEERFSRGAAGLAGAESEPRYRVWLEDWQVEALDEAAQITRITARMADGAALDVTLTQSKPPALQGDNGLSAKSGEIGNASYYYSLTRLLADGTVTVDGQTYAVTGAAWKDHEFGTSALGEGATGWDWFGLQFDDNRELMIGQIRLIDGGRDPYFGGLLVNPDGSTVYLPADSFTIEPTGSWTSPHTGATYPAGWRAVVNVPDGETINLVITPQIADQELHGGGIAYWEGTVAISGDVTGFGYAELTGYADSMMGRF